MDISNEELEEGILKISSCPQTRCSTPKHIPEAKGKSGSTSDLTKTRPTSTFDRISGILASFRDTRKALDESLRKNRELLQYVDDMEPPKPKLNFFDALFNRGSQSSECYLPIHRNDLKKNIVDQSTEEELAQVSLNTVITQNSSSDNIDDPNQQFTRITTEDLRTITTGIESLKKESSSEPKNVKTVSPMAKAKTNRPTMKLNNLSKDREGNIENVGTRDYGNFDFCVVEKKKMNINDEEQQQQQLLAQTGTTTMMETDSSFPRRRRPTNRFGSSAMTSSGQSTERRKEIPPQPSYARNCENPALKCKICFYSAIFTALFISVVVVILINPTVQLYLRLRTNYIHASNPPV